MIRHHGQAQKYYHDIEGYNGRLDAIQAGFLRIKLKRMPTWTEGRQAAALRYRELLADKNLDLVLPFEGEGHKAVYHLFVVRVKNREAFMKQMTDANIGTGIHYPIPLHRLAVFAPGGPAEARYGDMRHTERAAAEVLSLPMHTELTDDQLVRITDTIASFQRLR